MNRRLASRLVGVVVLTVAVGVFATESKAGWGSYGYSFYGAPYATWTVGYGGWAGYDYGTACGGYGCYDPCCPPYRPGLLTRIADCWRSHRYARWAGCYRPLWRVGWGCCDPCCDPCCNVCGCDPCGCDSCGSTMSWEAGKVYDVVPESEATPAGPTPMEPEGAAPANPPADSDLPSVMPEQSTSNQVGNAILTVQVPQNTKIYVNGVPTKSTGSMRRYVSRNLTRGFDYTYEVRAESIANGQRSVQTKTVHLRAGQMAELAFDAASSSSTVETALTVNVPGDAKVYLAGSEAPGKGIQRTFRTTKLAAGDAWKDYVVRVEVKRDGRTLNQEKKITLNAGDSRDLTFQFEVDRLADAR